VGEAVGSVSSRCALVCRICMVSGLPGTCLAFSSGKNSVRCSIAPNSGTHS
jgi:hypothetical protein